MKKIKCLVEWLICAVIGGAGFIILMLISEGLGYLVSAGIVALIIGGIVYALTENTKTPLLFGVFAALIAFVMWICICAEMYYWENFVVPLIIVALPYIVLAYLYFVLANKKG